MYSYADRLRAVELYLRLGNRLNATVRQLGYPTKNALRGWYREYLHNLDLRVQAVPRAPIFSEAHRQAALEHFRTQDRCISATRRALGYSRRGTLTAWVREAFPETHTSLVGRSLASVLFRGCPPGRRHRLILGPVDKVTIHMEPSVVVPPIEKRV